MRRTGAGVFYVNVPLSPGRIEYVFVVDGQPRLDEASMTEARRQGRPALLVRARRRPRRPARRRNTRRHDRGAEFEQPGARRRATNQRLHAARLLEEADIPTADPAARLRHDGSPVAHRRRAALPRSLHRGQDPPADDRRNARRTRRILCGAVRGLRRQRGLSVHRSRSTASARARTPRRLAACPWAASAPSTLPIATRNSSGTRWC